MIPMTAKPRSASMASTLFDEFDVLFSMFF